MRRLPARIYEGAVLGRPVLTLVVVAILVSVFAWFVPQFRLDASSDSLVLEDDAEVAERHTPERFIDHERFFEHTDFGGE